MTGICEDCKSRPAFCTLTVSNMEGYFQKEVKVCPRCARDRLLNVHNQSKLDKPKGKWHGFPHYDRD